MARLVVCGACERHVHDTEDQCPFCDAPIAARTCDAATPGLSRAAQYALRAGANFAALIAGAAVSASCASSRSPSDANAIDGSTDAGTSTAVTTGGGENVTTNSTTGSGLATATATPANGCGAGGTCPAGQYCLHPCSGCGGRAAQMGNCPPQPPARCVAGAPPEGVQLQGNDAYQMCPAMPYGCVFPNDCGRVSV